MVWVPMRAVTPVAASMPLMSTVWEPAVRAREAREMSKPWLAEPMVAVRSGRLLLAMTWALTTPSTSRRTGDGLGGEVGVIGPAGNVGGIGDFESAGGRVVHELSLGDEFLDAGVGVDAVDLDDVGAGEVGGHGAEEAVVGIGERGEVGAIGVGGDGGVVGAVEVDDDLDGGAGGEGVEGPAGDGAGVGDVDGADDGVGEGLGGEDSGGFVGVDFIELDGVVAGAEGGVIDGVAVVAVVVESDGDVGAGGVGGGGGDDVSVDDELDGDGGVAEMGIVDPALGVGEGGDVDDADGIGGDLAGFEDERLVGLGIDDGDGGVVFTGGEGGGIEEEADVGVAEGAAGVGSGAVGDDAGGLAVDGDVDGEGGGGGEGGECPARDEGAVEGIDDADGAGGDGAGLDGDGLESGGVDGGDGDGVVAGGESCGDVEEADLVGAGERAEVGPGLVGDHVVRGAIDGDADVERGAGGGGVPGPSGDFSAGEDVDGADGRGGEEDAAFAGFHEDACALGTGGTGRR